MTGEPLTPLDQLARVFAAIDAARSYAFTAGDATAAAVESLAGLDRDDLLMVAGTLAGLIAFDLRPTGGVSMDWWAEAYSYLLACRERGE